jgi:hypothetical protein
MRHIVMKRPEFYSFLAWVGLSLLVFSCRETSMQNCRDGECEYSFYKSSEISVTESDEGIVSLEVVEGHDLVFVYRYTYDDEKNIADDELTEWLYFQFPDGSDSFQINVATYLEHRVFFSRQCFCPFVGYKRPTSGTIEGKKITEDQWEITLDLDIDYYEMDDPFSLSFTADFYKN